MTIKNVLETVREVKPSRFYDDMIIGWLSDLEQLLVNDIFKIYKTDVDYSSFTGYNIDTDRNQELLVPDPYSDLYLQYIYSMIDYNNGEIAKYNASVVMFNNAYDRYAGYVNRTCRRVKKPCWRF